MKPEDLKTALEILSSSLSATVSFNVPIKDSYSDVHQVLILKCNTGTINKLVAHNFSLTMTEKGLSVDKF